MSDQQDQQLYDWRELAVRAIEMLLMHSDGPSQLNRAEELQNIWGEMWQAREEVERAEERLIEAWLDARIEGGSLLDSAVREIVRRTVIAGRS